MGDRQSVYLWRIQENATTLVRENGAYAVSPDPTRTGMLFGMLAVFSNGKLWFREDQNNVHQFSEDTGCRWVARYPRHLAEHRNYSQWCRYPEDIGCRWVAKYPRHLAEHRNYSQWCRYPDDLELLKVSIRFLGTACYTCLCHQKSGTRMILYVLERLLRHYSNSNFQFHQAADCWSSLSWFLMSALN